MVLAHLAPAAGAPTGDLIGAGIVGFVALVALGVFGVLHRSGRVKLLTRVGDFSTRASGLPAWAAIPAAVTGVSLLVAVFGFYWDVSTHIDNGRDPGPFANPSHYLIIFGLAGIALAGYLAILLGSSDSDPAPVEIRAGWRVPVGGILLLICGGFAVLGFPLDDVWHRIYGQDVTLWSPTHLQMVGGAALSTLALWVLLTEGRRAAPGSVKLQIVKWQEPWLAGAFLLGLNALQAEFDFSVPQFRILYHPVLLMLAAGIGLVAARLRLGRGGALKAVAVFLVVRGLISLAVGPIMGHTTPHFPLYLVEALAVEGVALLFGTARHLEFGALAGVAIGTLGLAAEWAWSHVWMVASWHASLFPEGVVLGFLSGVAGGLVGAFIARALSAEKQEFQPTPRWVWPTTAVLVFICLGIPFPTNYNVRATAHMTLTRVGDGDTARAKIQFEPPGAAQDADLFNVTAWQGGGSVVEEPEKTGPGTYEVPDPIPVTGDWKTLIRLHKGASLMAVPVYLPRDPAIPAAGVPAPTSTSRSLESDKGIVLREAKDVGPGLVYAGSGAIAVIAVIWIVIISWGLVRLDRGGTARLPFVGRAQPAAG